MGLETGTYIDDLNASWPLNTDQKSAGDDHIRLIKSTLKSSLPGLTGSILDMDWFLKPDGSVAMTGAFDAGSQLISDVADPVSDQDAATKAWVLANGFASTLNSGDELLCRLADHTVIPTGFTIGTIDNKAIRLRGNAAAGADGGSNSFTSALNGNISSSSAGSHSHGDTFAISGYTSGGTAAAGGGVFTVNASSHTHTLTGAVSSGGSHSHTTNVNVQYRDFHSLVKI